VRRLSRSARIGSAFAAVLLASLLLAPGALATNGEGLAGSASDKTVTLFCFGVIAFFPILVIALSLLQGRLDARKERRRYDLERLDGP
jgi:hypothetical protein